MILQECMTALPRMETMQWAGRVRDLVGLLVASDGPAAAVGDFCEILSASGKPVRAQVVGFRDGRVLLMPLEETGGLQAGDKVVARAGAARIEVSPQLLGRVLTASASPWTTGLPSKPKLSTICMPRRPGRSSVNISPNHW